ncbi:MAG: dienelactone hydrolase family protein [Rhodospirillales bacterium]|nr:dienelactone hydrolase family protein [Rhodospirillales bacterium]
MAIELQFDGPKTAPLTLALAHGAGAPSDSPFMTDFAHGVARAGWRVARFEFPYMAARRLDNKKRPPDRANVLLDTWQSVIDRLGPDHLIIGGKSLGGRMASMIADAAGVRGVVCLGYPFHPVGQPEKLRITHLQALRTATLILQGTRDPFGLVDEITELALSPAIRVHYLEDGDHSFVPRAKSSRSEAQNREEALCEIVSFLAARAAE